MTLLTTSGYQLSKFKKTVETAASDDFVVVCLDNCLTLNHKISQTHHTDLPCICTGYVYHKLLTVGSHREKKPSKCRIRRLQVEFLEKALCEDHQISQTHHTDLPCICTGYVYHKLLTVGSHREKKPSKCRIRRLQVEFLEKALCEDHQISHGCRGELAQQMLIDKSFQIECILECDMGRVACGPGLGLEFKLPKWAGSGHI